MTLSQKRFLLLFLVFLMIILFCWPAYSYAQPVQIPEVNLQIGGEGDEDLFYTYCNCAFFYP